MRSVSRCFCRRRYALIWPRRASHQDIQLPLHCTKHHSVPVYLLITLKEWLMHEYVCQCFTTRHKRLNTKDRISLYFLGSRTTYTDTPYTGLFKRPCGIHVQLNALSIIILIIPIFGHSLPCSLPPRLRTNLDHTSPGPPFSRQKRADDNSSRDHR